jgi:hypothetical protein
MYVGYWSGPLSVGRHVAGEAETCRELCALVCEEIADLQATQRELPPAATRPMREVASV